MSTGPREHLAATAREEMLTFRCDWCEAAPGSWCVTTSGKRAGFLHSSRWYKWREAADAEPVERGGFLASWLPDDGPTGD